MTDYKDAKAELQDLVHDLEKVNPSAARSLSEGLEETLTLHRLGVPELLRISLSTTNIIESCLSRMEHVTGRVKRWQGGDHVQRWMATALLEAEKKFRTVKGYRSIKDLMDKMNTSIAQKIA
jgi:transposase-like protein